MEEGHKDFCFGYKLFGKAEKIQDEETGFASLAATDVVLVYLGLECTAIDEVISIILAEKEQGKTKDNVLWITTDGQKKRVLGYEVKKGKETIKVESRKVLLARLLSTLRSRSGKLEL